MSDTLAEYRATQEHIRALHLELREIAAAISAEGESLRRLAEEATAIAERRTLSFEAVLTAAANQRRTTTLRRTTALTERLAHLTPAQESAVELYETLTPEERVGLVPPPTATAERSSESCVR